LSFEEKNISEKAKFEIMRRFEKMTFAGFERDRYDILWIEHTDKNRLELNFVIPRIELSTGKAFNPHWHQKDQKKLLLFQDIINSEFGFSNPFAATKQKTLIQKLKGLSEKGKKREEFKRELHDIIVDRIELGTIKSRDDILKFLTDAKIDFKKRKNSITIIRDNKQKIRFQGIIYKEDYDGNREIKEIKRELESKHRSRDADELARAKRKLEEIVSYQANRNIEQYRANRKAHKSLRINKRSFRGRNPQDKRENSKEKHLQLLNRDYFSSGNVSWSIFDNEVHFKSNFNSIRGEKSNRSRDIETRESQTQIHHKELEQRSGRGERTEIGIRQKDETVGSAVLLKEDYDGNRKELITEIARSREERREAITDISRGIRENSERDFKRELESFRGDLNRIVSKIDDTLNRIEKIRTEQRAEQQTEKRAISKIDEIRERLREYFQNITDAARAIKKVTVREQNIFKMKF
jgi:uncharacterized protein YihD (DUF1040 family)